MDRTEKRSNMYDSPDVEFRQFTDQRLGLLYIYLPVFTLYVEETPTIGWSTMVESSN